MKIRIFLFGAPSEMYLQEPPPPQQILDPEERRSLRESVTSEFPRPTHSSRDGVETRGAA